MKRLWEGDRPWDPHPNKTTQRGAQSPTESERALATQSLSLCGMERGFARGASSPLYQQESGSNGEAQRMLPPWLGREGEGTKWSPSNS